MVILFTALFMALGLVNLDFGRNWMRGQALRLGVGLPVLLVYAYIEMPPLVFPQCITLLLLTLVPNAAYSILLAARTALASRRVVSIRRTPARPYLVALAIVGAYAGILAAAPFVDAGGLRDLADVTVSNSLPPNADIAHVRVVPQEAAIFAGNKVVGQLGAYYRVGDFNVQVTNKKLVWVAPLEYQGFIQWLSRRTSPGVIVVSAENPDEQPELRERAPMRYVPSALLNENLYRHVYMRYGTEQILETTLQLDDAGNPQYLCTLGRPTIGWTGTKVTGVAIVDPATGEMRRVDRSAFASLPSWVSRVYPADLALAYNEWFGEFVHGIWNYLFIKRDVHVPARDEVFGLLAGSRFVWFVDHTSPASDQSMTGFTYMDTVTGGITYYTSSGGEFNSRGSEDAVASNPIVRQGKLIPTQPLLYNAFGQNTWVVPLVAETGKYQTVALVQAKNGHVVVGSSSNPSPQTDAFAQYAAFLGGGALSASGGDTRASGTIDRIGTGPDG
ncbi:MAG: hypothetical protein IAI49_06290, partial [Candidatus Eremiobacteraeota bacterium]|nr:hypothetical protein [Candidatus Eremiobacteraeota bacterium]